jgi:putative addiction module component (TIGR02574 family)
MHFGAVDRVVTSRCLAQASGKGYDLPVSRTADVRAAAMELSEPDRLALAAELLESVEGPADPDWERAWVEEIRRREASARDGSAPPQSWDEVRVRLSARFPR